MTVLLDTLIVVLVALSGATVFGLLPIVIVDGLEGKNENRRNKSRD